MIKNKQKYLLQLIATLFIALFITPQMALADQYDDFIASNQQHNIISNEHFLDVNSMSVSDIQNFLNSKGSYLAGYSDGGRSAAQIIYDAAHGKYEAGGTWNGIVINESTGTINPALILVFLQKEQSLISKTSYDSWAMTASMGYFCYAGVSGDYNGNNCKDIYEGFTKQVENGAWQLRYNYEISAKDANWWNTYYSGQTQYRVGNTITAGTSRTPPSSYQVTLSNQATASCYRYTPYVFFGNYNVWNLYHNIYDFDNLSLPAVITDSANDTSYFTAITYNDSYSLSGGKSSNNQAFFNNSMISDYNSTNWSCTIPLSVGAVSYYIHYKDQYGRIVQSKHISIDRHKLGDINGDFGITIIDLSILASFWGHNNPAHEWVDINRDGTVNIIDLSILASNWAK